MLWGYTVLEVSVLDIHTFLYSFKKKKLVMKSHVKVVEFHFQISAEILKK